MLLPLLLCLAAALAPQDPNPPPPPPVPMPGDDAPLLDVDGRPLVPGAVPESTSPTARERWKQVVATSLGSSAARAPVSAFDLILDVQYHASSKQTNDMSDARYQWLAPNMVRADTGRGRMHLRGPRGSFLVDNVRGDCVKLDVGRDTIQDRRQLDEEAGIAANFARLTDPGSIRLRKLVLLAGPPALLPESLKEDARKLAWFEIESPDFFVMRPAAKDPARMARVTLGVNVIDNRVAQVVVDDAATNSALGASTAVLRLSNYQELDGFQVPHTIFVWLPDAGSTDDVVTPPRWMAKETMSLYVKRGSLRATLTPTDFLPPEPGPR